MRIAIIASGNVGLVSGACFADLGHDVICVDKEEDKIASLNAKKFPIYERGPRGLVEANSREERLELSTDIRAAVETAEAFMAVGTPTRGEDGPADLRFVYTVAKEVADAGAKSRAYDPRAIEQARPLLPEVAFCPNAYVCAEGASASTLTEWDVFHALDFKRIKKALVDPVAVDPRNIYGPAEMRRRGFRYSSVGRQ